MTERRYELGGDTVNFRRPTKSGIISSFSDLLYYADCGEKLYYSVTGNYKQEQAYFFCSSYRKNSDVCSAHYIREKVVEQIEVISMDGSYPRNEYRPHCSVWPTLSVRA